MVPLVLFTGFALGFLLSLLVAPYLRPSHRELGEAERLIKDLRSLASGHSDVSPELSTVVIDEITKYYRGQRPSLSGK